MGFGLLVLEPWRGLAGRWGVHVPKERGVKGLRSIVALGGAGVEDEPGSVGRVAGRRCGRLVELSCGGRSIADAVGGRSRTGGKSSVMRGSRRHRSPVRNKFILEGAI